MKRKSDIIIVFYTSFEIRHKCLGNLNFLGVPLLREAYQKS